jgi:hypothetical protein
MKAIDFPQSNVVYAKNQPEYLQLPVYRTIDTDGIVISCWYPTMWEAIKMLFGARIWLSVMTMNKPLQPQCLEVSVFMPKMEKKYNVSERKEV